MKHTLSAIALAAAMVCPMAASAQADNSLYTNFLTPPHEARPQVWWHWMNGNISKDGIYKDLMWMNRVGIGGIHIFDAGLSTPKIVPHRITYMTPEWKDCFRYAVSLADSLGMDVAIPSSPGWSNTGGPWVKPEQAMKKVTWRMMELKGGKKVATALPAPFTTTGRFQNTKTADWDKYTLYKDIAVIAVRIPSADVNIRDLKPTVTASKGAPTVDALTDGDVQAFTRIDPDEKGGIWVQYSFAKPVTIKALTYADGSIRSTWNSWSAPINYHLEASTDGTTFTKVCDVPQSGIDQQTIDVPATTASHFRLVCDSPKDDKSGKYINLTEFSLYTTGRINFAEEKAGFTTFGDLDQYPTTEETEVASAADVVDVTNMVDADGNLVWNAPKGNWRIYRFGWSLMGKRNGPASPEATGLEADKLDPQAMHDYIEHYIGLYVDATGGMLGAKGITQLLVDSYESGKPTWTPLLPQEFEARRGYSMLPWMPVLTGTIIESVKKSEQFLYDFRQTIGELMNESLYGEVAKAAKRHGLETYFESHENGRQMLTDGITIKAQADIPMGAMWAEKTADLAMYECDIRESASTAHIYGKKIVAGESFTANGKFGVCYSFYPGNIKPIADYLLGSGLNRFIIHESAHQPMDSKRPGVALSIYGQWFNRHETWAEMAKPWMDYLGRSSYLLQQGEYVADIAYYYGGDNSVNGRFGHNHPAIPRGYSFDYVNPESLMKVFAYDGKNIVTNAGMKYRLLVIDKDVKAMTVDELRALAALAKTGTPICGNRPNLQPELKGNDAEWSRLVSEIWDSNLPNVMANTSMEEAVKRLNVSQDINYQGNDSLRWLHRKTADADIYWICNAEDKTMAKDFDFRVTGKKPEIWNAVDGSVKEATYTIENGRTRVHLDFESYDAVFVIFKDATTTTAFTKPATTTTEVMTMDTDWEVAFEEGMDAPATTHFDRLASYTDNEDLNIRYFSGTATYTKTFSLPKKLDKRAQYILDLGKVGCIAEVSVNGMPLGTLWKAPYTIDITKALKKKNNTVEIKVANLWVNRIIGDRQPGNKKRHTWCSYNGAFNRNSPLLPSGLMGTVKLLQVNQ